VLHLEYAAGWKEEGLPWTQQPELYLSGGKLLIPRLELDVERNGGLNSTLRSIRADLDPAKEILSFDLIYL
jgi:hypothetical protein